MMRAQDLSRAVAKLTARLQRRVMLMVGRALLTTIDDSTKAQSVQVALLADEVRDGVERFQEYGFTSVPDKDCEAVVVFVGGNRSHGIVVATEDRRYRVVGLDPGEVCLYTKDNGKRVLLKADGMVLLGTDPEEFVALGQKTDDRIQAAEDKLNDLITKFNAHIHITTATIGPSAAPGTIAPTTSIETALAAGQSVQAEEVKGK